MPDVRRVTVRAFSRKPRLPGVLFSGARRATLAPGGAWIAGVSRAGALPGTVRASRRPGRLRKLTEGLPDGKPLTLSAGSARETWRFVAWSVRSFRPVEIGDQPF